MERVRAKANVVNANANAKTNAKANAKASRPTVLARLRNSPSLFRSFVEQVLGRGE